MIQFSEAEDYELNHGYEISSADARISVRLLIPKTYYEMYYAKVQYFQNIFHSDRKSHAFSEYHEAFNDCFKNLGSDFIGDDSKILEIRFDSCLFPDLDGMMSTVDEYFPNNKIILSLCQCKHLDDLSHLPYERLSCLEIESSKLTSLESMTEGAHLLENCDLKLSCENLTSLKGLQNSQHLRSLIVLKGNISSFEGAPEKIDEFYVWSNIWSDNLNTDCFPKSVGKLGTRIGKSLMFYHHLYHYEKRIEKIKFSFPERFTRIDCEKIPNIFEIERAFTELPDPFEFQEWCLNNNLQDYT
jgi:hypothetical protein